MESTKKYLEQIEEILSLVKSAYDKSNALKSIAYDASYEINNHLHLNGEANEINRKLLDLYGELEEEAKYASQKIS